jgi:iron complex outermembrane receptor protein
MKNYNYAVVRFFSPTSRTKHNIRTVTDSSNNHNRVSIYVPELHKGTATDLEGRYSLTNLPVEFEVVIWICGYSNQVKTIKIKPNQNDLNVTLEPTVFEMDAVIVSTAFNKIQSQNVMKV